MPGTLPFYFRKMTICSSIANRRILLQTLSIISPIRPYRHLGAPKYAASHEESVQVEIRSRTRSTCTGRRWVVDFGSEGQCSWRRLHYRDGEAQRYRSSHEGH